MHCLIEEFLMADRVKLPHTGPDMRVARLQGDIILVLLLGLMGRLPIAKVTVMLDG